jgi:hypothetical protein
MKGLKYIVLCNFKLYFSFFSNKFYKLFFNYLIMGKILNILNKSDDRVEVTLEFDLEYFKKLRGNLDKVHLFSEDVLEFDSKLVSRGKGDSTKYLLIPKEINTEVFSREDINYSVIEEPDKFLFIFGVNKF